ncbi:protein kinase C theta type-like [Xenopus laevis]|uniref:Protein kinase C theta type-like n=1 Tax=Xenopus laevis TaxID=8355 RepID=A0A8J1LRQ2_XENLA|nr:protein kinase C theta type-like [Xenopus laevis]
MADMRSQERLQKRPRSPENVKVRVLIKFFSPGGGGRRKKRRARVRRPAPLQIRSYKLLKKLGQGSFGNVMLASFIKSNQLVAIKIMKKRPEIMEEHHALRIAEGSPFLCHAYAAFQSEMKAFFVLEYASGGNLEALMENGRFSSSAVMFYAAEIVCGLQYLHSKGIVHRDIKPANILLDGHGHIKICDFGFAVHNMFGERTTRGLVGTYGYMAPEVMLMEEYNAAVDWWSLGVILYRMATGRSPFYNGRVRTMVKESTISEKPKYPEWLSGRLRNLLKKLLKKNPLHRLGTNGNIRKHPFFASVDWVELERQRLKPPIQPQVPSSENLGASSEELSLSLENGYSNINILQEFSFLNPTWQEYAVG